MTIAMVVGLLLWGALVAVDLVTVPQGLFSRPLVAATVAGWMAGDIATGLLVGAVLELYALEVLPIGASRYPDYGPAAVAGGAAAALIPAAGSIGIAGLVALPLALLGGWSMHLHRRMNARAVDARRDRVEAGDARAIWELQRDALARDGVRGLLLSLTGLLGIAAASRIPWELVPNLHWLDAAVLAGGLAAALSGAVRSAGQGARRRWLAVGLATGLVVVLWL